MEVGRTGAVWLSKTNINRTERRLLLRTVSLSKVHDASARLPISSITLEREKYSK